MGQTAFSKSFQSASDLIVTPCKVSDSYDFRVDSDMDHPEYVECSAMWDTGAAMSVVSHELAERLSTSATGYATMLHANGDARVKTFYINVLLPNKIEVQMLQVMESNLLDTDMLLGMDVIGLCDVGITHPDGNMLFTFDTDRSHIIDFTK